MKKILFSIFGKLAEISNKLSSTIFHAAILLHKESLNKIQFHKKYNFMNSKEVLFLSVLLMSFGTLKAQVINEGFEEPIWTSYGGGSSTSGQVIVAGTNANTGSIMTYLTAQGTTGSTTATNTCPNTGTWWYSKATSQSSNSTKLGAGCHSVTHSIKIGAGGYIITPLTPAAVVNVTFWAATSGTMLAALGNDPNMGQPGYNTSTSSAPGAFSYYTQSYGAGNSTMTSYSFNGTFTGPCRFGVFNSSGNTIYVDDIMVYAPTGNPPTVTTNTATPAITSAAVNATVTIGSSPALPLLASGVIWSTTPLTGTIADTLLPKTRDMPAATGSFTDAAGPLVANTLYYTEAYVIGLDGSVYFGTSIQFTTLKTTVPLVSTAPATAVFSNKATVGGIIVDSGGLRIKNEVIKYGTNKATLSSIATPVPNPTPGSSFSLKLSLLQPNTKYYYQACATNSLGTSCGNIDSFTTGAPVPVLTAIPAKISFGNVFFNTNSPILSYTLTGSNLTPGNVTITVAPNAGYVLSTSSTFAPASSTSPTNPSLTIPQSGTLKKVIYVKFLTSKYGSYNSVVTHSGGGTASQDADSVFLSGNIVPAPDNVSNMGTDFWLGYPYEENMKSKPTKVDDTYGLILYISSGSQQASVVVDMPLMPAALKAVYNFPRTVTVAPNTVAQVQGFPIGDFSPTNTSGAIDTRLFYTGVSNRGINVQSTNGVPVAVWMYNYATNNSAGGSMLFPSNTWNSSYTVQAYGGISNNSYPNSFFFVIANDDYTPVTFTPSNDIIDSSANTLFKEGHLPTDVKYHKDSTYTINLNKGQVFNAMGFIQGSGSKSALGLDLSGTKVSTTCDKKIAVFGGNGRCLVNTLSSTVAACNAPGAGSDNLVQQMLPKVAWGTKYLTVPTKTMEYNIFRITVSDPTTIVKVNGAVYTSNWNARGSYYELEGYRPFKIESDKPVNVTQFITSGDCKSAAIGNNGDGDPEMIILSPIQQSITSTTVLTPDFKNTPGGGADYINVVIPHAGVASFKLDGKTTGIDTGSSSFTGAAYASSALINMNKAFIPHPQDTAYYYAKFKVNYPATHTLTSNVGFIAFAYGLESGESWGYNAGTNIKNLSDPGVIDNPQPGGDTSSTILRTCKDNLITIKIAFPYLLSLVDSVVWSTPPNAYINHSDTTLTGPIMIDPNNPTKSYADTSGTITIGGQLYYLYTCPIKLSFSEYGFYPINATAYGKFKSDCDGYDNHTLYVQVGSDNIDFKAVSLGCGSTSVKFTDSSAAMPGTYITKWDWDLGDSPTHFISTDSNNRTPVPNPHVYPGLNKYIVYLTTLNSIGCYSKDSVVLDLAFSLTSKFVKDNADTICPNTTITFTDSSSSNAAVWNWHFGEPSSGANDSSHLQNPTHTYTTPGMHIITLQVFSAIGCPGNIFSDTIYVSALPKPDFKFGGVCLPGSTVFTNNSDTATGFKPYTYLWSFGDGGFATTKDGTHTYTSVPTGGYPVKLIATNKFGCVDSITKQVATIYAKPTADFTIAKSDICIGTKAGFLDNNNSTATNQTINQWHWFFGDGRDTITTTNATPHIYTTLGTDSVKLVIQTDKGCVSDTSVAHAIKINPLPTAAFIVPGSCLTGGAVTFTDKSSVTPDDGTNQPFTYSWVYDPATASAIGTTKDGLYQYSATGTYQVSQTVTTAHGCSNTITQPFVIAGSKPRPYFYVNHKDSLCNGFAVTVTDTSRIDIGTIGRVDVQWDASDPVVTVTNPGNGKPGTSTNYTHTYTGTGTHYIKLIAYAGTSTGCSDSVVLITPITIYPQPTAAFIVPGSCLTSGASVVFTDQSTITPDDGTNKPFTYSWVYDPGPPVATGTSQNGTYNYTKVGLYNVSQTVTSQHGCTNTITQQFDIAGSQPIPAFYVKPNSLCSNVPVFLTDTSRIDIGVIKKVEIYWNWTGVSSTPDVTDNSPSTGAANSSKIYTHSYPALGADKVYAIRLVAYSGATCFHDTVINITVHGSPNVFFGALSDICLNASPLTLTATDLNSLPGSFTYLGPTGTISGNTFDPSKLLPYTPGTYNIKAVYTTTAGCVDTTPANPIRVLGLPKAYPIASYPLCEKRAINFTDTSNAMGGTIVTRIWVIDGNVFSGSPQIYYYSGAVNDVVKLIVTTSIGCNSDTAKLPLIINPLPHLDFNIQSSTCLPKGTTQMTDLTTLPGTAQPQFNWLWNFGDIVNNQSALQNPSHDYTSAANYNITLKVTSSSGCDSSLTKTLLSTQIHPAPVASYTVTPAKAQVCLGDSILFTDNSAGTVVKSIWYYGDGSRVDTAFSVHHAYDAASTYTATHAIIDNNGCISVTSVPTSTRVTIDALPIVNAGYDKYVVIGDSVVLNEVSVIANNFTSWWSTYPYNLYLNDTTLLNPVFAPTVAGNYNYMLTVKSFAGCIGTSSINLIALDPPIIPNTFSPNGDGIHDLWEIGFLNKYPGATVKVFNRYGQLIYNVLGYFKPWDGTVNGAPLPIGTYYYIISPRNGLKDIIGTITIIR